MSHEYLNAIRCDGPGCMAYNFGEDLPAGWTRISSTRHIAPFTLPRGERRRLSYSEMRYGNFDLDLCALHAEAFDGHRPKTTGSPGKKWSDYAQVECECGATFGRVETGRMAGYQPAAGPERAWWRHLPAELGGYATRGSLLDDFAEAGNDV